MTAGTRLVLGVGNPSRGDDGAGREVARRLMAWDAPGLVARETSGELADVCEACAGFDDVVIVDAAAGPPPGRVLRFDGAAAPLPAQVSRASTHGVGVAEAVELLRALGRLPRRLTVYAVAGHDFAHGHGLSPAVARAVEQLARRLMRQARA